MGIKSGKQREQKPLTCAAARSVGQREHPAAAIRQCGHSAVGGAQCEPRRGERAV